MPVQRSESGCFEGRLAGATAAGLPLGTLSGASHSGFKARGARAMSTASPGELATMMFAWWRSS